MGKKRTREQLISDLTKEKFDKWTVTNPVPVDRKVEVTCDCGTVANVAYSGLFAGKSTGCFECRKRKMTWFEKNAGKKVGFLTPVKMHPDTAKKVWCICDCGSEKYYNSQELRLKESRSCGCNTIEMRKEFNQEKYGVDWTCLDPEIKKKQLETLEKNYGVSNPLKSQVVIDKLKATNMERYGVEWTGQAEEIKNKILQTKIDSGYESKGEAKLRKWIIDTFGVSADKSYCGGASPCEIDIHIPEKNISIEYNGDMWHSEYSDRGRNYHSSKTELVREQKGCHLTHIFESEYVNNPGAVEAFITAKLTKGKPVRASKCKVVEVDWKMAKEFCQIHLQGHPQHSILNLGLEYEGELISLMTFSNPHRQTMESLPNLSRYVIKPGHRIHGGLSKLSKEAWQRLGDFVTFVHLRLSDGKSYEKCGYELTKKLPPDYWYWDIRNNKAVSKQSRRKGVVGTPVEVTERDHAIEDGLYRIWDCGKLKFKFSLHQIEKQC